MDARLSELARAAITMDRPRIIRLIRIALSAACLVACGILIVLWVRSYRWDDKLAISVFGGRDLSIYHAEGRLSFLIWTPGSYLKPQTGAPFWTRTSRRISPQWLVSASRFNPDYPPSSSGFGYRFTAGESILFIPYWCPVLTLAALAVLFNTQFRLSFSLRTMLIAMTFVAVVLGLIEIAAR